MNRSFGQIIKLALLLLATSFLFACDGDNGDTGATGPQGPEGPAGPEGPPAPAPDDTDQAIAASKPESCATCHDNAGGLHQAQYDEYVDGTTLVLTLTDVTSVAAGADYVVTLTYNIMEDGMPVDDAAGLPSFGQKRFEAVTYDGDTGLYLNECRLNENHVALGGGVYTVQDTNCSYAPELQTADPAGAQVYGYIARGALLEHDGGTGAEFPAGTHVHLYDDVASAAIAYGTAQATDPKAYESAANVSGCENCHGTPYMKHGYRDPVVAGIPDFASCKSCHYDNRSGNHDDWQYMVDQPYDWATGAVTTADYDYTANIMNDTHMSHAMEFPYPQSAANCSTCHAGKLTDVLDNSNFTAETCQSCHPIKGTDAWPEYTDAMGVEHDEGMYFQAHRAPAFDYLWTRGADLTFHDVEAFPDCVGCHGAGIAPPFSAYHNGYDATIYDDTGTKYSTLYTVSIDQVTQSGTNGEMLTIDFTSNDPAIVPEVLVSMYGWDSKHFIIASHSRDGNPACVSRGTPGCRMEYTPESSGGGANPMFVEVAGSAPGAWSVTLDMSLFQAVDTDDILTMIADGEINKAEITITPELELNGVDVVLSAVDKTFDFGAGMTVDDYFKGANATVEIDKCNACHDSLASSFHDGSGRAGDGIEVCKNCHATVFPGSHMEMDSRAIDSYVHAIHSFQDFDVGDTFETFDPVLAARYNQHVNHVFPNFTIRNCEACHTDGTYNVPDQSQSMPGVMSSSDVVNTWYDIAAGLAVEDPAGRNIGFVPEYVSGPASRACGGCHRARLINDDEAGGLASFNAHTEAFGTLVENDDDDVVLYGVIDKIMSMFE